MKIRTKTNNKLANHMGKYIGDINTNLYYYFLNRDKHTELASNVIKAFDESDFMFYNRRVINKLTEKEFLEIQRDFLATHDERMLKLFNSHLERGLIDMRGNNDAGVHLTFCSNNHYVVLSEGYSISNLLAISHELGRLFG